MAALDAWADNPLALAIRSLDAGNEAIWTSRTVKMRLSNRNIREAVGVLCFGYRPEVQKGLSTWLLVQASLAAVKDGLTLDLGGGMTMELVKVPAGEFVMGSPYSEEGREVEEGPKHRVRIAQPFFLGRSEVTQAQWMAVTGRSAGSFMADPDQPAKAVSWDDCQAFCRKLSWRTGHAVRLPSEAEWEYACRAGTQTAYSFGDTVESIGEYAWYDEDGLVKTHPVMAKRPNAWGLYDMHGNVWELCEDVWHDSYWNAPSDGSAWIANGDPTVRVTRGAASYDGDASIFRSAYRRPVRVDDDYMYVGLRVLAQATAHSPRANGAAGRLERDQP